MKITIIMLTILILLITYVYFTRQKYIEISSEKEEFKNITIHKFENHNI
jgi:hypothetical protein